jgi:hypothetical protein
VTRTLGRYVLTLKLDGRRRVSGRALAMRVACFCGAVFDADPPVGICPYCDAPPAICASSATEFSDLEATYNEGLNAIRDLPDAA